LGAGGREEANRGNFRTGDRKIYLPDRARTAGAGFGPAVNRLGKNDLTISPKTAAGALSRGTFFAELKVNLFACGGY
jgi:hypothetical protein